MIYALCQVLSVLDTNGALKVRPVDPPLNLYAKVFLARADPSEIYVLLTHILYSLVPSLICIRNSGDVIHPLLCMRSGNETIHYIVLFIIWNVLGKWFLWILDARSVCIIRDAIRNFSVIAGT